MNRSSPWLVVVLARLPAAVIFVLLGTSVTWAATYDLVADWSDAANPNSAWTYRDGTRVLPSVPNWTPIGGSIVQPAWAPSVTGGNYLPAWFRARADGIGSLDVRAADVVVHTTDAANGPASGPANVIWTSPVSGVVNISGGVWMARDIGRSNAWTLFVRGAPVTSGTISSGDAFSRANPFDFVDGSGGAAALTGIRVSAGDVVELRIVKTSTFGDFVGVNLTIAETVGSAVVTTATGGVQVTFQGAPLMLGQGSSIVKGAQITTGTDGHVRGRCPDSSEFGVGPNTRLFFDDAPCEQTTSGLIDVIQGQFDVVAAQTQADPRSAVAPLGPGVRTPVSQAIIASAGTIFSTAYSQAGTIGTATTRVTTGAVQVVDPGTGEMNTVTAGKDLVTTGAVTSVAAAVLPSSRSARVQVPVTAFVTIVNGGNKPALACKITKATPVDAALVFQATDPTTNQVVGAKSTPVSIPPGVQQAFVIALTPGQPFSPTDVEFAFTCGGTQAVTTPGVNTLLLSASAGAVPDIVALAATLNNDGIVNIPGAAGTGVFAVATVNLGASDRIVVIADTGSVSVPVALSMCLTNRSTGVCLAPPSATVQTQINAGETPTFGIFVRGLGPVTSSPAVNRVFVRFKDAAGNTRGATSVAVKTQ